MNNAVTTPKKKEDWLQIRITPELKAEAKIVADSRELTVSALVSTLLKKAINEEKSLYPHLFRGEPKLVPVVARIGPSDEYNEREEIKRRLASETGMPLATRSKKKMPAKIDESYAEAKRRAR